MSPLNWTLLSLSTLMTLAIIHSILWNEHYNMTIKNKVKKNNLLWKW
uniref:ATP synthase F0 subunit 8 n=1 Tax=Cryptocellus narino TaxID=1329480 RepID=W5R4N5_9ARAC|nr:ATP synthase F0 subunit 8 [Cryptocellus narino]AGL11922.1 ATP synthase F0 subunit 8 [Cryptocellus narino]